MSLSAPAAPAPSDLAHLASALLSAVGSAFDAAGLGLSDRRYITTGEPTAECGALVVSWARVGFFVPGGLAGPFEVKVNNVRSAELTLWVFRCLDGVPKGQGRQTARAPSQADLTRDGTAAMKDAVEMHRAVVAAQRAGTFGDFGRGMSIGDAVPLQPDGSMGGVWMSVAVQLS